MMDSKDKEHCLNSQSSGLILPYQGKLPKIHESVFVAPGAILVGEMSIGEESSIWYNCTLRGDVNYIDIGKRVNIQDGTVVHVATFGPPTLIGDDVSIGHMALIHACDLQKGCFVGMKAMVMDGAVVESEAMVAAGALVGPNKRVEKGWLWAGVPAKPIRKLTDKDYEMIRWTASNYVKIAKEHRVSLGKND